MLGFLDQMPLFSEDNAMFLHCVSDLPSISESTYVTFIKKISLRFMAL